VAFFVYIFGLWQARVDVIMCHDEMDGCMVMDYFMYDNLSTEHGWWKKAWWLGLDFSWESYLHLVPILRIGTYHVN
jgi:hypothetical protein